ncbi:MAG: DMT family transporter [Myxococcales bacterium]|nr:DMT family transporter [Myxococcota bacterium]MDW8280454.1 DMT family transporter [Myxococcales bacterium]
MRWVAFLAFAVLAYGLAQGLYKQAELSAAQFCVLFVLVKTLTNGGSWAVLSQGPVRQPGDRLFYAWALAGQILNGLGWIGYFLALSRGPAALVGTITAAYTAVTVGLALIFLKERPTWLQAMGVFILIVCGMALAYEPGDGARWGQGWLALSLGTLLLWGTAVCIFKHAYRLPAADDARFFLTNWAGAALTLLPYGLLHGGMAGLGPAAMGLGLLVVLLYALGDLALFCALRRGPAFLVAPLSGLYPLPTLVWAVLVLQERISPLQGAAVALTLAGIVLVAWPAEGRRAAPARRPDSG